MTNQPPEALRLATALQTAWLENVNDDQIDVDMVSAELRRLYTENIQFRRMLCATRHGSLAYMDDGEASWGGDTIHRQIDYIRESPAAIQQAWLEANIRQLATLPNPPPWWDQSRSSAITKPL